MDYLKTEVFGRNVVFRDLLPDEVDTIVSYWHDGDPDFLYSLGLDPAKLVSRNATRERILSPGRAYFVIEVDGELVAYTNLNFRSESEACAHFHVLKPSARVKAVMYVVFPDVIQTFFSCFPLARIEMQTLPENRSISRMLRRFGLKSRREFLSNPDGLSRPGELHIWELKRSSAVRHRVARSM